MEIDVGIEGGEFCGCGNLGYKLFKDSWFSYEILLSVLCAKKLKEVLDSASFFIMGLQNTR
jgi:hypothetical protein